MIKKNVCLKSKISDLIGHFSCQTKNNNNNLALKSLADPEPHSY